MKDLLTGLAALMAAAATAMSFILSTDVTTYQDKLAKKRGVDAAEVLLDARRHQRWFRILFLAGPSFAAVILCIWALFLQAPGNPRHAHCMTHSISPRSLARLDPRVCSRTFSGSILVWSFGTESAVDPCRSRCRRPAYKRSGEGGGVRAATLRTAPRPRALNSNGG